MVYLANCPVEVINVGQGDYFWWVPVNNSTGEERYLADTILLNLMGGTGAWQLNVLQAKKKKKKKKKKKTFH